jgi:hypothetical protein
VRVGARAIRNEDHGLPNNNREAVAPLC